MVLRYSRQCFRFSHGRIILVNKAGVFNKWGFIIFLELSCLTWWQQVRPGKHRIRLVYPYRLSPSSLPFWKSSFLHDLVSVPLKVQVLSCSVFICLYKVDNWKILFTLGRIICVNNTILKLEILTWLINCSTVCACLWECKIRSCRANTWSHRIVNLSTLNWPIRWQWLSIRVSNFIVLLIVCKVKLLAIWSMLISSIWRLCKPITLRELLWPSTRLFNTCQIKL